MTNTLWESRGYISWLSVSHWHGKGDGTWRQAPISVKGRVPGIRLGTMCPENGVWGAETPEVQRENLFTVDIDSPRYFSLFPACTGGRQVPGRAAAPPNLPLNPPCHQHQFGSRPSDHYFRIVCLFVCAEFFSAVFDLISIKLGHMLYVWV